MEEEKVRSHRPVVVEGKLEQIGQMFEVKPEIQLKRDDWKVHQDEFYSKVAVDEETKSLPRFGPYLYKDEKNTSYTGQYKHGKRHGRGEQVWEDGSVYDGYWKDDKITGKGMMFSTSDIRYRGDHVDALPDI